MEYYNPENRDSLRWASLAVVIYFALFVVLVLTIRFSLTVTDPASEGILVEFGQSNEGVGDEELAATDVAATPPPPEIEQQQEQVETDQRSEVEIEQQEVKSDASTPTPQKEQPIEQPDTVIVEERVVNQNALFPGRKEQSTATSQGSSAGAGNQGAESGGESGAAVGGGLEEGVSVSLGNRKVVGRIDKPENTINEGGRVVIAIRVNEAGIVTGANHQAQGSTTNNSVLIELALKSALKARFTPDENVLQEGIITYVFIMD